MREIKEFEFLRGERFFEQMVTFSLAVTGFRAIVSPESLVERRKGRISYSLGGLIVEGKVCGSIVKALEVAETVKMRQEIIRVAFEENSFPTTPSGGDVSVYLDSVASVCIIAANQSIEGPMKATGKVLTWPPEIQYLRLLRHAAAHGNKFKIENVGKGIPGIDRNMPPKWRTSVMPNVDHMQGKQLFDEFLLPGDIPVLLSDIQQMLPNGPKS